MSNHITSRDPRKPAIVAALKRKSGGTKVTLLEEIAPGQYRGNCLRGDGNTRHGGWTQLGTFEVTEEEVALR